MVLQASTRRDRRAAQRVLISLWKCVDSKERNRRNSVNFVCLEEVSFLVSNTGRYEEEYWGNRSLLKLCVVFLCVLRDHQYGSSLFIRKPRKCVCVCVCVCACVCACPAPVWWSFRVHCTWNNAGVNLLLLILAFDGRLKELRSIIF